MKNVPSRATGEAMPSLTRRLFLRGAAIIAPLALVPSIAAAATPAAPDRLQPLFDAHAKAYAAFTAAIDVREEDETEETIYAYDIASDGERMALWNICAFICQTPGEHVRKGEFLALDLKSTQLDPTYVDCIVAAMTGKALRFEDYHDLTPIA